MADHPDPWFRKYIVEELREGFRVGFDHSFNKKSRTLNLISCNEHPETVSTYIKKEVEKGHLLGPFSSTPPGVHCSPFGVIPKKNQPGEWCLIVDLSSPASHSINDGILPELCSLSYVSVDIAAEKVLTLGKGALMAKLDIKSAFRLVPVHPADRHLLGLKWEGHTYIDKVLPFGLRSAPKIFNAIADALQFIAIKNGIKNIAHYLDDYLIVGPPASETALTTLAHSQSWHLS